MNSFDEQTRQFMRSVLDATWSSLTAEQRRHITISDMAYRILRAASNGERDPVKLTNAALQMEEAA